MGVSEAFSLCWRTMWMLDMARRTCFREEYYTGMRDIIEARKIAGPDPRKLYVKMLCFVTDISGLINSFGLALLVGLE